MAASTRYYNLQLAYQQPSTTDSIPDDPVNRDDPRSEELSGDWLRLSQTPFEDPPEGGFYGWLQEQGKELTIANFAEYNAKYQSHCSEDKSLVVTIEVARSRQALAYTLIASYGVLSQSGVITNREVTKSQNLEGTDSIDLSTYVDGAVDYEWENDGKVYGENGQLLDKKPTITQVNDKLTLSEKTTGTLRLKYTEVYEAWTLTIVPRSSDNVDPNNRASAYESTVRAFWGDGNVETLQVTLPDMKGDCGDSLENVTGEEDEDGECYDLYIKYKTCTGKEISRTLVRVKCPDRT